MEQNTEKNRKSESQEIFEQADNAGRFAGEDTDAQSARLQAQENIRQDTSSSREERNTDTNNQDPVDQVGQRNRDMTDAEARRDPAQSQDYKGESQNVNDDNGRPLTNEDELQHARNKANEGKDDTAGIP